MSLTEVDQDQLPTGRAFARFLFAIIARMEPAFGGIKLENIKAPECFYIEKKLRERMKTPVFHDDQDGACGSCFSGIANNRFKHVFRIMALAKQTVIRGDFASDRPHGPQSLMTMAALNETHDPTLTSWVPGSHPDETDFPIQNLPFGTFSVNSSADARVGVAIGSFVLDLRAATERGILAGFELGLLDACIAGSMNALMSRPPKEVSALRLHLSRLLRKGATRQEEVRSTLLRAYAVSHHLPASVRNFSDFFTSIHHATNSGRLVRPANPLLPNYQHLPVAYHGRSSTLRVSGTPLLRPRGQYLPAGATQPVFGPTQRMDFEAEIAIHIGAGNDFGEEIPIGEASQHIFGISLLNDWSARDLQVWEAQPLGPFLAKSAMTSVSPWVVTTEALAPFRVPAANRTPDAPPLLPHLADEGDRLTGGLDIAMEVLLRTPEQRKEGAPGSSISKPCFRDQYWTVAQMLAHQTSNGCTVEPGDILGTGTVSGPNDGELGCLMELTRAGSQPIALPGGGSRTWLEDGDELILRAQCSAPGAVSIGFGECAGQVMPSRLVAIRGS